MGDNDGVSLPLPVVAVLAPGTVLPPDGPAFDVVLLAHIACAVLAIGTVAVSGVQAERLRRALSTGELGHNLRSYYRPGINWAGRTLHAVPVLGLALVAMSHGAFGLGDTWVMAGLGIWVVAAMTAEGVLWPAERRLQAVSGPDPRDHPPVSLDDCTTVRLAAWGLVVVLIAAMTVMVAQP